MRTMFVVVGIERRQVVQRIGLRGGLLYTIPEYDGR